MAKPQTKSDGLVHLYWGHDRPNAERILAITRVCWAACDVGKLPPEAVTLDRKKVTCPDCRKARARAPDPEPTPAVPAKSPPGGAARLPRGNPWPWPPGARIHVLTPRNPQRQGGSRHARWAVVWKHDGKPWEKYRDAGGNSETLRNVVRDKYAEVK